MATAVEPHTGQMAVMGREGDVRTMWNKDVPAEVEAARAQFDALVGKSRYAAFRATGERGERGAQIRAFDPEAERIILVPPLAGG
jgi:hypothetical protein